MPPTEEFDIDKAGGVAAGIRQTLNEARSDWVGDGRKHNGNCVCLFEDGSGARRGFNLQHLKLCCHQLFRGTRDAFGQSVTIANGNLQVDARLPSKVLQALKQSSQGSLFFRIILRACD